MVSIKPKREHRDGKANSFESIPLRQPLFLNGLPRSGSDLLRNILRTFVPVEQQYDAEPIQPANLRQKIPAFDPRRNYLSLGYLFFTDISALALARVHKVLVYADPYDWVLARARFYLSGEIRGTMDHLKGDLSDLDQLLTLMIFGNRKDIPSLAAMYELNVVAWLGSNVQAVRREELLARVRNLKSRDAATYFENLLEGCGISPLPADWRERVQSGASDSQSAGCPVWPIFPRSFPKRTRSSWTMRLQG
jgi:hypothetical protein